MSNERVGYVALEDFVFFFGSEFTRREARFHFLPQFRELANR